jgi:aryl-alcohol dehydrogenase-like predicted oxidoreductase
MIMNNQPFDRITLGSSDLRVSPLGVGTNSWTHDNEPNPELQSTFEAAQSMGINLFDTAEMYSLGGSERRLGQIMQATSQRPIIATKFFPLPWRLARSSLISALRDSLKRLQMTQVDLYQIHFPWPPVAIETWMDALADAVEAGLTRTVGVSNYSAAQMRQAHAALSKRGIVLASNQVEYSMLKRDVERNGLLAVCRELHVTLIAYRPIAQGLVTGKYTPENPPKGLRGLMYNREYLARIQPLIGLQRQIGEAHGGKAPSQVALNWLICKGALPIPGAKSARQAQDNAGALGWRLTDSEVAALDEASSEISK